MTQLLFCDSSCLSWVLLLLDQTDWKKHIHPRWSETSWQMCHKWMLERESSNRQLLRVQEPRKRHGTGSPCAALHPSPTSRRLSVPRPARPESQSEITPQLQHRITVKTKRCSLLEISFALIKTFIEISQMLTKKQFLPKVGGGGGGEQLMSKFNMGAPSAGLQQVDMLQTHSQRQI